MSAKNSSQQEVKEKTVVYDSDESETIVDDMKEWFARRIADCKGNKKSTVICDHCQPSRHFKKQKTYEEHVRAYHRPDQQLLVCNCMTNTGLCVQTFRTQYQMNVHKLLYEHKDRCADRQKRAKRK